MVKALLLDGRVLELEGESQAPPGALIEQYEGIWRQTHHEYAKQCALLSDNPADKKRFFRPSAFEAKCLTVVDRRLGFAAAKREWAHQTPGYIKVQAYASGRLAMQAGFDLALRPPVKRKAGCLIALAPRAGALERPRETQRDRSRYGLLGALPQPTKFTSRASHTARDAGTLIESQNRGQGWFWTATCPGSTKECYFVFSQRSGQIVNRLNRYLRERCVDGWFVYVWEVQQRGAPHLHYMFRGDSLDLFEDIRDGLQRQWRKILRDVSLETCVDLFARNDKRTWINYPSKPECHLKPLHSDHAHYIAKYISKSKSKSDAGSSWYPGRWSGCAYPLLRAVRLARVDFKCHFDTGAAAATALSAIVAAIEPLCQSLWVGRQFETFGTTLISMDFPPGRAKQIALAIASAIAAENLVGVPDLVSLANCA